MRSLIGPADTVNLDGHNWLFYDIIGCRTVLGQFKPAVCFSCYFDGYGFRVLWSLKSFTVFAVMWRRS